MRDARSEVVGGPFYEELAVGDRFDGAPGLTLTSGHAALHQAILGDQLRLALDAHLCAQVAGPGPPLVHPGLVCDVAIGQSTLPTQRVIGNLFYRGLALRRWPRIGDTLRTNTEIVALRDNAPRADRAPTGLAVLRVRTTDQADRPVLDFHRCAMLPMQSEAGRPGHTDDVDSISPDLGQEGLLDTIAGFDLSRFPRTVPQPRPGRSYRLATGDTVSCATELVRLSLNVAGVHTDPAASSSGRRLVYGGHTVGVAFAQVIRALPDLVTVAGWRRCDHLGPVFEGDVLHSVISVEAVHHDPLATVLELGVKTYATRDHEQTDVLDWRIIGLTPP